MIAQSHSQPIALPQQAHHYQGQQQSQAHVLQQNQPHGQLYNQQQMQQAQYHQQQYMLQQQNGQIAQPQQDFSMQKVGSYNSLNGDSDQFNPESFTRQFLGSPISWRMGSYGTNYGGVGSFGASGSWSSRIPVGSPTAQLLNSIDFRTGKTPSSVESDSIMNAFNVFEREGELCRNYTCCGQQLNDLHALLEHFEEVHVVIVDRPSAQGPQAQIHIPFNPTIHEAPSSQQAQQQSQQLNQQHFHQMQQTGYGFDAADDMELDIDLDNHQSSHLLTANVPPPPSASSTASSRSSPSNSSRAPSPDTPISTPLSGYPSPNGFSDHQGSGYHTGQQRISHPGSPLSVSSAYPPSSVVSTRHSSPVSEGQHHTGQNTQHQNQHPTGRPSLALNVNLNIPATGVGLGNLFPRSTAAEGSGHNTLVVEHPGAAFNAYARFASDYSSCMPGAQFNGATVDEASAVHVDLANGGVGMWEGAGQQGGCLPPHLLFASASVPGDQSANGEENVSGSESLEESGYEVEKKKGQKKRRSKSPQVAKRLGKIILPGMSGKAAAKMGGGLTSTSAAQYAGLPLHAATAPTTPTQGPGPGTPFGPDALTSNVTAIGATQSQGPLGGRPSGSNTTPSTPSSLGVASLLSSKPFRCPKPNCNKSYKQANGLKYHITHGSCSFGPPKEMEHVQAVLERRIREVAQVGGQSTLARSVSLGSARLSSGSGAAAGSSTQTEPSTPTTPLSPTSIMGLSYSDLSQIPQDELEELEREAERRLRPYACGIGDCTRRYKNMNGLRYHYQHSGDHGVIGLNLLANGQHESLALSKRSHAAHSSNSHYSQSGTKAPSAVASTSANVATSSNVLAMGAIRTGTTTSAANTMGYPIYGNVGGSGASGSTTMTTAIMPTTVQAQAFVVPNSSSNSSSLANAISPSASGQQGQTRQENGETQLSPLPLHLQVNPVRVTGRTSPPRTSPSARYSPMSRPRSTSPRQRNAQAQQQQHASPQQQHAQNQAQAHAQAQAQYNQMAAAYNHYANIQRQYAQAQQQAAVAQVQAAQQHVQVQAQAPVAQNQQQQPQSEQQQEDLELEMDMDMGNQEGRAPAANASPSAAGSPRSPNAPGSGAGLYVNANGEFVGERPSSVENYGMAYMGSPQHQQQQQHTSMAMSTSPYHSPQQQNQQPPYQGWA